MLRKQTLDFGNQEWGYSKKRVRKCFMGIPRFLGIKLEEFHWGMVIAQKFMWIINLTILLKVFNVHRYVYFIALPFFALLTWLTGYTIIKTGIKDQFLKSYHEKTFDEFYKGIQKAEGK